MPARPSRFRTVAGLAAVLAAGAGIGVALIDSGVMPVAGLTGAGRTGEPWQ
jgi:hypothetical protein